MCEWWRKRVGVVDYSMNVHGGSCSVLVLLILCACLHVVHEGHIHLLPLLP